MKRKITKIAFYTFFYGYRIKLVKNSTITVIRNMSSQLALFQLYMQQRVAQEDCLVLLIAWILEGVVFMNAICMEAGNMLVKMNTILLDLQSSHV